MNKKSLSDICADSLEKFGKFIFWTDIKVSPDLQEMINKEKTKYQDPNFPTRFLHKDSPIDIMVQVLREKANWKWSDAEITERFILETYNENK